MEACLRLVFLLLFICRQQISALSLKGGDFPCTEADGQEIRIPGITDVPTLVKIKCVCEGGVGKCRKITDQCLENLKGCHFIQEKSSNLTNPNCAKECRSCKIQSNDDKTLLLSGESYLDKCRSQQCFSGVLTTTTVQCATPMCPDPTPPTDDQCCPSCKGCSRAGQLFKEGETKDDILDPCNECTCKAGHLQCVKRACPVLPCSKNLERRVKGKCCPICSRSVEYSATPNTCLFRGRLYKAGQTIPMGGNSCSSCKCGPAPFPTVTCERTSCPALLCPAHMQKLSKGKCCEECQEGGVANALPAIRAEPNVNAKECSHQGKTYQSGDMWTSGCETCNCWSNGHAFCHASKCPVVNCPKGAKMVQKQGACCPSCEYQAGVCTVFGDPHYRTFDGRVFNFQGSCKYLLAKDGCGLQRGNSSFSVRITNDARDSLAFSWTRTITVRFAENDLKISLLQKMKVKVNGKKVTLPYILMGKLSIFQDGYRVVMNTNDGLKLLWDGVSFLEMTVSPKYRGQLCGLCGNFNGDSSDDFSGQTDGQHFGDSWRVGGLRACSVLPKDMPKSYEPECTQSWSSRIKSDRFCNALKSQLFAQCTPKVDPDYYFNACKLDMCECPGDQCHCEVLTAYARECERAGVMVYNWREMTGCKNVTSFTYTSSNEVISSPKERFPPLLGKTHEKIIEKPEVTTPPYPVIIEKDSSKPEEKQAVPELKEKVKEYSFEMTPVKLTTSLPEAEEVTITTTLPDWILGPYLPACSSQTAEFCRKNGVSSKKKKNKHLEKRRKRRKQRQQRRRKILQRKRRLRKKKQQRKRGNNHRRRHQQTRNRWKFGNFELKRNSGDGNSKFQWSSSHKRPPFEALLSSDIDDSEDETSENHQQMEEEAAEQSSKLHEISSSEFNKNPVSLKQRTPLPLKEAQQEQDQSWKRRKRKSNFSN